MNETAAETLCERPATGSTPDACTSGSGKLSRVPGPLSEFAAFLPCDWCDRMPWHCPCGAEPEPCQCGGPSCPKPAPAPRPYLRARPVEASLDDTVAAVINNVRRAA